MILYAALAKGPHLPFETQLNSTRQFMRELNRLGLTGAIDAGGGMQNYPQDYAVVEQLAREGALTIRIAYNLFTQNKGHELEDFQQWTRTSSPGRGDAYLKHNGAGEMLVFSAADFEDFLEPRPELPSTMEAELEPVIRHLAQHRWPFRLHATYDESIERMLNVFERVNADIPFDGLHWFIDHAETISPRNIERIQALGGGIAIQHRMAFQGEYFLDRYGPAATRLAPPVVKMLEAGVAVGAGTDATRVASYNPWTALYWLVSGRTVGGTKLNEAADRLSRETALELWTIGSAWFSNEQGKKGQIKGGLFADMAVLNADYFQIDEAAIKNIESVLTIVGGKIVHAAEEFRSLGPPALPVLPDWSPVSQFPGHYRHIAETKGKAHLALPHQCVGPCGVHGHAHDATRRSKVPVSDFQGFWGALGCSCFAF
jgi:predicted amidohydrolase YtcJ